MKRVMLKFLRDFACKKCEWNIGESVQQEENVSDGGEKV